jgi:hypothetical protein
MNKKFEYKFVRLEDQAKYAYAKITDEYTGQGWRLLQVFAPGAGGLWGSADYIELIFEREASSSRVSSSEPGASV